jgi:hypothetical protein
LSRNCHRIVNCLIPQARFRTLRLQPRRRVRYGRPGLAALLGSLALFLCHPVVAARRSSTAETYGAGLSVRVPVAESELLQAVEDVAGDGIIQGTKEYNKDEYVGGAEAAESTRVFPAWAGPGRVFYKVRKNALDPRNFKDSGDSGTLAVRYVVEHGDEKSTILKIDAIFVDDFKRRAHPSNGSVEAAEYKAIQDHLAAAELKRRETREEEARQAQKVATEELERERREHLLTKAAARRPDETIEQHVERLRHQLERLVKPGGTELRSAPFKSASSLKSLAGGAHVVILISTPYWYGVEAEDGQHGWIHHSQLEPLP